MRCRPLKMKPCRFRRHQWRPVTVTDPDTRQHFFLRECRRCGETQIQSAGPMGNGKWKRPGPLGFQWTHAFEREQFVRAYVAWADPRPAAGVLIGGGL